MIRRGGAQLGSMVAAVVLAAAVFAGCGDFGEPAVFPAPTLTADLAFACRDVIFPAAALAGPEGAEMGDSPAAAALRRYVRSGVLAAEDLPLSGYRVLSADENLVVFATNGEVGPMIAIDTRNTDGIWTVRGLGVCAPLLALPAGLNGATWRLPVGAPMPDPNTASFVAMVTERECVSGRSSAGRVLPPLIVREPTRVLVVFAVLPPPTTGMETCPGNPPTPVTVDLGAPLGVRELLDGSVFPPAQVWSPKCCG